MSEQALSIAQVILARAEFAHRENFLALPPDTKIGAGSVEISVQCQHSDAESLAMASLQVHNKGDQGALYSFDVQMVVVLNVHGPSPATPEEHKALAGTGAAILFPFVREAVASLTSRGRFGPLWLQPINVRAVLDASATKAEVLSAADVPPIPGASDE
jgi:preprotein translocase subunit SecB